MPTSKNNGSNRRFYDIAFDEATHTYLVDGKEVPSVTEILTPLHRSYGTINQSVLEYAANRGRAVHEALEMYDLGGELEVVPETAPYIQAYLDWCDVYRPRWIGVEQIVYNESNGYIGTLDRIGSLNGTEFAVVDIKTSQPTKEALVSVCCQTAAYAMAYAEQRGESPRFAEGIKRYGLFLKADGTFRFLDCEEYEYKYGFSGALVFFNLLTISKSITQILETKGKK